jgi:hypothetical protein
MGVIAGLKTAISAERFTALTESLRSVHPRIL